jgi:hypothetical protein
MAYYANLRDLILTASLPVPAYSIFPKLVDPEKCKNFDRGVPVQKLNGNHQNQSINVQRTLKFIRVRAGEEYRILLAGLRGDLNSEAPTTKTLN